MSTSRIVAASISSPVALALLSLEAAGTSNVHVGDRVVGGVGCRVVGNDGADGDGGVDSLQRAAPLSYY